MKPTKSLAIFAVAVLALPVLALAGCETDEDPATGGGAADASSVADSSSGGDAGEQVMEDTAAPQPEDTPAAPQDDVVQATDEGAPQDQGPNLSEDGGKTSGDFTWVRIDDAPEVTECPAVKSPGADIDAVVLLRDGEVVGYATTVVGYLNVDFLGAGEPCDNDAEDEQEAVGEPDAGLFSGSVSLNGGTLLVQLADGAGLVDGDVIRVVEVSGVAVGTPEAYRVSVGTVPDLDGEWTLLGTGEAEAEFTVTY